MQPEDMQQRGQPHLIQHHEADQHQPARQRMGNVEGQAVRRDNRHHIPLETNSSSTPSRPSIRAAPRKLGTRNTRIFATDVSAIARQTPPTVILTSQAPKPMTSCSGTPGPDAMPMGENTQAIMEM